MCCMSKWALLALIREQEQQLTPGKSIPPVWPLVDLAWRVTDSVHSAV
jgi:hypothetical protein